MTLVKQAMLASALLLVAVQLSTAKHIAGPFELDEPIANTREGFHRVGDMELTNEQWSESLQRNAVTKDRLWPIVNGKVPIGYKISDKSIDLQYFKLAMESYERKTCIRFFELPEGDTRTSGYLDVTKKSKCSATLGYVSHTFNDVSLDCPGYEFTGALHEIGHAIGLNHEQSRSDRDNYIKIQLKNIKPDLKAQYVKEKTINHGIPYDYMSIMHYGATAATIGHTVGMLTKDPRFQNLIGNGKDLSFLDIKLINTMYQCTDSYVKKCKLSKDPCLNLGYLGPACNCHCPRGTMGKTCEKKDMDYNDAEIALRDPLSKIITTPGTIKSINYPKGYNKGHRYIWVLRAPKCHNAVMKFKDFQMYGRSDESKICNYDRLEIRASVSDIPGKNFCSTEIKPDTVFKSTKQQLILEYTGFDYLERGMDTPFRGFTGEFTFEPISGCT